jgi:hypothetical protein
MVIATDRQNELEQLYMGWTEELGILEGTCAAQETVYCHPKGTEITCTWIFFFLMEMRSDSRILSGKGGLHRWSHNSSAFSSGYVAQLASTMIAGSQAPK